MNALDAVFLKCRAMKFGEAQADRTDERKPSVPDEGAGATAVSVPILRCLDQVRLPQVVDRVLDCAGDRFGHVAEELLQSAGEGAARIAMTSSVREEGRTTLALATARWIADHFSGKRVLLVDADLMQPKLTELINASPINGPDSAEPCDAYADSLVESGGLAVLGVAPTMLRFDGDAMAQWNAAIDFLRPHFDLMLFDSAPVTDGPIARACIEALAQAAVWLRDPSRVCPEEFGDAQRQLSVPCLGVIENLVPRETVDVTEEEKTFRYDTSESLQSRPHRDVLRNQPNTGAMEHV